MVASRISAHVPALLLVACLALGCGAAAGPADVGGALSFELASLSGETVRSSSFAGQVVLLDFWATWCTPCVAQAEILEPLYEEFRERDVSFLAISLGEDAATVQSYVERRPFPYEVLIDPQDELSGRLGIYALPTVMILDRDGNVAFDRPGLSDGEELRRVLEEMASG